MAREEIIGGVLEDTDAVWRMMRLMRLVELDVQVIGVCWTVIAYIYGNMVSYSVEGQEYDMRTWHKFKGILSHAEKGIKELKTVTLSAYTTSIKHTA